MTDEATENMVQGGDPIPAGDSTPPAITDEAAGDAGAQNDAVDGAPGPDAEGSASDGAHEDKDPNARMQRRIDKLTARNKGYEEEMAKLREELEGLKGEREKRELEDLKGLPVMPEALTADERKEVKTLRPQLSAAAQDADWWFAHAEDGATVQGKEYSPAQCREFGRMKEREAARIEARLEGITDKGRTRLATLLKKHGGELFGEAAEPPKAPATPPPVPKKAPVAKAPERAPGGGTAPSGVEGAGKAPAPKFTQEMARAAFAD